MRQNPYGRRNRPAVNYRKQMQNQFMPIPPKQRPRCPSGVHYVGNIFLLGVSTLLSELINLRAATTLEYLLEPFQCEDGASLEQDIAGLYEDNKFLKGILLDISGGGLRFATDNKINVGEVIELKLRDINTEDEILIKGQCVRGNKESNGQYICSVRYYEISNKIREKIIESIFTLMRKQRAIR